MKPINLYIQLVDECIIHKEFTTQMQATDEAERIIRNGLIADIEYYNHESFPDGTYKTIYPAHSIIKTWIVP
jgi:hypothetical protein